MLIKKRRFVILMMLAVFLLLSEFGGVLASRHSAHGGGGAAGLISYLPVIRKPGVVVADGWPMVAANPARTSWVPEEVKGNLKPLWFKPFDAYILPRTQIIASNGLLYVSTARGLYALDAETGAEQWVYPTELPLGNSPTIYNGVAYVGGFDRKLHAIDAFTGQGLWTYQAGAGFDTNPLVVGDKLYAGNRDGAFYALYIEGNNAGQLAWKYQTDGPIHFSAAYQDGVVYFASNDSYAYALDADTGALIWKSDKLPGAGFHSWWPVIYNDYVIFAGSNNYRFSSDLGPGSLLANDRDDIYPNKDADPRGTLVGPLGTAPGGWASGTPTIDTSKATTTPNGKTTPITEYFEAKPWRRTYFVLDRLTGQEYTSDFDNDGKPEYAPILWVGAKGAGNRYPPVVGADNVLYQPNNYMSDPSIAGGQISGWQPGSPFITIVSSDWGAVDEPVAYSAGGNLIYWNLCCDRQAGAFDISVPNSIFAEQYNAGNLPSTGKFDSEREWLYFNYNLDQLIPGYNQAYYGGPNDVYASYGGPNGIYGYHGDQNPPIPYNGKVYMHRGNSVLAFSPDASSVTALPPAEVVVVQSPPEPATVAQLSARLENEVQNILDAGHLRPGYISSGIFDLRARFDCGDDLVDYWHSPGDTIYTLILALPYLPADMQAEVKTYIQNEFAAYPPYTYTHIGWADGAPREPFDLPPEVEAERLAYLPKTTSNNFEGWGFAPHAFYAMWKYAEVFGGAQSIFDQSKDKLEAPPPDSVLLEMPYVHNAFIAGYIGYLELEALAGYPPSEDIQQELDRLLSLRAATFSKDAPPAYFEDVTKFYCRTLNVSRNFMYMVPELAEYLRQDPAALAKVQEALDEYEQLAPYWFVSKSETVFAEGVIAPFYDYATIFQARAMILQESFDDLEKYLDVPATMVGDLYYIQNLVTLIDLGANNSLSPLSKPQDCPP